MKPIVIYEFGTIQTKDVQVIKVLPKIYKASVLEVYRFWKAEKYEYLYILEL